MSGLINIPTASPLPGLTMIADINAALAALATMVQSGSAPTAGSLGLGSLAGVWWHDTTNKAVYLRDQADTVWMAALFVNETGKQVGQADTAGTWMVVGGTGNAITLTLPTAPASYVIGQKYGFKATAANSGATTVNVNGLGAKNIFKKSSAGIIACVGGEIQNADIVEIEYDGTQFQITGGAATTFDNALLRGTLAGMGLVRASATTITFGTGMCANDATQIDAGNPFFMKNTAASTKTLQNVGAWAAGTGNNGLFSGARANSTWYHCFAIRKTSDGSTDFGFDTSITAANIPAGYVGYRRIGSIVTDVSGNIVNGTWRGSNFMYDSPTLDFNSAVTSGARVLVTLASLPLGLRVEAYMVGNANGNGGMISTDPSMSDLAPLGPGGTWAAAFANFPRGSASTTGPEFGTWCDTSQRIGIRLETSATPFVWVVGYFDPMGRFD